MEATREVVGAESVDVAAALGQREYRQGRIMMVPSDATEATAESLCDLVEGSFVYFLMRAGECVYVGQSTNLAGRITGHLAQGLKSFDQVLFVHVEDKVRLSAEKDWIAKLRPRYNGRQNPDGADRLVARCVKVSDEDWARWQAQAAAEDVPVSIWMRQLAAKAIKRANSTRSAPQPPNSQFGTHEDAS